MLMETVKRLCTPAYVYLVLSIITTVLLMVQNSGNQNTYCVGSFECPVPSTPLVFFTQLYLPCRI